jgi:hypothetical protein
MIQPRCPLHIDIVGAISTAYSSTQFDLKDQPSGGFLGRLRASGIFLAENGTAGTIQQVDLKVWFNPDFAIESAHEHSMRFMSGLSIRLNRDLKCFE